jgi:hypothetical protein
MRCASAGTPTTSGVTPAALWACRVGGPGSAAAASRAHDSSGRRSFPSTPAPAIWVVGVISDRVDAVGPDPDPQPLHVTATAAATEAAAAVIDCLPNTSPTLTSGQLALVRRNDPPATVGRLRQFVGPGLPST